MMEWIWFWSTKICHIFSHLTWNVYDQYKTSKGGFMWFIYERSGGITVVDCSTEASFPNRLNSNWPFHRLPLGRSRWKGNHELVVFSKSPNLELGVLFANRSRANKSSRSRWFGWGMSEIVGHIFGSSPLITNDTNQTTWGSLKAIIRVATRQSLDMP